ncbi:hypothetical protein NL676_039649 [Syzygium grande]|nr:hypothetical protein NL676_039649 [Syzygium grande]
MIRRCPPLLHFSLSSAARPVLRCQPPARCVTTFRPLFSSPFLPIPPSPAFPSPEPSPCPPRPLIYSAATVPFGHHLAPSDLAQPLAAAVLAETNPTAVVVAIAERPGPWLSCLEVCPSWLGFVPVSLSSWPSPHASAVRTHRPSSDQAILGHSRFSRTKFK